MQAKGRPHQIPGGVSLQFRLRLQRGGIQRGSTQPVMQVYESSIRPLVDSAFQGAKVTCFAYGQTGSGKTHTMNGSAAQGVPGMYALGANDIFEYLANVLTNSHSLTSDISKPDSPSTRSTAGNSMTSSTNATNSNCGRTTKTTSTSSALRKSTSRTLRNSWLTWCRAVRNGSPARTPSTQIPLALTPSW